MWGPKIKDKLLEQCELKELSRLIYDTGFIERGMITQELGCGIDSIDDALSLSESKRKSIGRFHICIIRSMQGMTCFVQLLCANLTRVHKDRFRDSSVPD